MPALDPDQTCDLYAARLITPGVRSTGVGFRCRRSLRAVLCGRERRGIAACEVDLDPDGAESRPLEELETARGRAGGPSWPSPCMTGSAIIPNCPDFPERSQVLNPRASWLFWSPSQRGRRPRFSAVRSVRAVSSGRISPISPRARSSPTFRRTAIAQAAGSGRAGDVRRCRDFDYDNDGKIIYFTNGVQTPEMRSGLVVLQLPAAQQGRRYVRGRDRKSGLTGAGTDFSFGVAVGDYDDALRIPVHLLCGQNRLYHNNGNGTFTT